MNPVLLKIFATALAFSQVTANPDAIKTQFDPAQDQAEVVSLLRAGCAHMRKAFGVEDINLDDLISTAMEDPKSVGGEIKAFRGLDFGDLVTAYREFCKNETVANSPVNIPEVIGFYNKAAADLPDHTRLKHMKLPGVSEVLDRTGKPFTEVYEPDHRRVWVPIADIPEVVQRAFVSAEDKRFFQHHGIDERGLIRAFIDNLAQPGRPQGGSTITQQVAKNLLVGDDVTYERKIREMIVAARLERTFTKSEILELYLNSIYLGRSSWGIEMAARSYFGKPARDLTLTEGAMLAGLTKGPSYFSPDRYPDRAHERLAYVLNRMREDAVIDAAQMQQALAATLQTVAFERVRRDSGFYFVDYLGREAKSQAGIESLTSGAYTVRSTIDPQLQRAVEASLQEGLARYELNSGRIRFQAPEANLGDTIRRAQAALKGAPPAQPLWQLALANARLPLYDVHWTPAIVLEPSGKRSETLQVGLVDGRTLPLTTYASSIRRKLKPYDVVLVRVEEARGKYGARAELRVRPQVQGAAIVLENKTGRILAMAGGFSYPLSQLNRVTQAQRQPGSAIKPLTYLAALQAGLQPNTLVQDEPITLPPIEASRYSRDSDYWSPKNYEGSGSGIVTLRRGLENSKNLVTAHLLDGGIEAEPADSLDRVCTLAKEAQIYTDCVRYYPFVLGAQPVRPIDLAGFYAAVANEGARPAPYAVESVEQNGLVIYRHDPKPPVRLASADRVSFYQLKTMLQGVLERGTARAAKDLAPYVGGKTGTSEDENDTWFAGFTNDVTVVVWVGYDNAEGRRTLGAGNTGARVSLPIFESIIRAAWQQGLPKVALAPPSPEARAHLAMLPIDVHSGELLPPGTRRAFTEYFRRDDRGAVADSQYSLISREEAGIGREPEESATVGSYPNDGSNYPGQVQPQWGYAQPQPQPYYGQRQYVPQQRGLFGFFAPGWQRDDAARAQPRRVDPDYFWQQRNQY